IRALGFSQGFDVFDDALALREADRPARRLLRERPGDETVDLLLDWLRTRPDRPFFAWVHLFDPHQPYAPPAAFLPPGADAAGDPNLARLFSWPDGSPRRIRPAEVALIPLAKRARVDEVARARYRGELAFVDTQVGRIVEALRRDGVWDRTVFVFAGDHGENFGDRGELAWAHAGLFHDVTHVPLLVRIPGARGAGGRPPALVGNMDVAPTILDALGVAAPPGWKGRSLRPAIETPESFVAAPAVVTEATREREVGVRTPEWMYREMSPGAAGASGEDASRHRRLGYGPGESEQLFDLGADPLERSNVASSAPGDAQRMKAIADAFLASKPATARAGALGGAAHREALKALGYAD
ncbi:MAG: sulfatase, partial [Alphaproteobacteria bacterium]